MSCLSGSLALPLLDLVFLTVSDKVFSSSLIISSGFLFLSFLVLLLIVFSFSLSDFSAFVKNKEIVGGKY